MDELLGDRSTGSLSCFHLQRKGGCLFTLTVDSDYSRRTSKIEVTVTVTVTVKVRMGNAHYLSVPP